MDAADPPPSAGIGGKLRQRLVSIIDSLHAAFPDGLIVERPDADVLELYTETHFVLACVLLHLTGDGSADRLAMAEARLRRWSGLRTEDPFNNFGNCLSLALLRARGLADLPLGRLLETICLGQTPAPLCREVGNNILVMKLLTELVVRPLALGGQPAPAAWPEIEAMLDRYRSSEGFYFDEPRDGAGERYFPGTYCLMFLFLIGLVYSLTRRAAFLARFIDGLRAVLPLFTEDGGFSYLGRSDNTTFANGLAIFCLRLGATANFAGAEICGKLLRAAEAYFLTIPQTQGGWPKVNRFANGTDPTGDVRSRDEYTHPANYAAAAVAYILAGEFSGGSPPAVLGDPVRRGGQISRDLGIARLAAGEVEVLIRTRGQIAPGRRRYLGPTILRVGAAGRLSIGAIPIRVAGDAWVRLAEWRSRARHAVRLARIAVRGREDMDPSAIGFLPYLVRGGELCVPAAESIQAVAPDRLVATYAMQRFGYRDWRFVAEEIVILLRKNLRLAAADPVRPRLAAEAGVRLTRSIAIAGGAVIIEDRIEGAAGWKEFRIATRALAGAKVDVEGLCLRDRTLGWSSDGPVDLALYSRPTAEGGFGSRIAIRFA